MNSQCLCLSVSALQTKRVVLKVSSHPSFSPLFCSFLFHLWTLLVATTFGLSLFSMADFSSEVRFMKAFISHKSSKSFAIPLGFNEYFPDPLPITVDLLDYSGRSWTVRMKRRGEKVFLTLGWENFVRDNNVEDGKYLNFIYDCDRTFYVIIFGHDMCCEFRNFPQVVVDVDDYETAEDDEEEEEQKENNK